MFDSIDVRALSEIETGERAVLTVYLRDPRSTIWLERRCKNLQRALCAHSEEQAYFEANMERIWGFLEEEDWSAGGWMFVVCDVLDVFKAHALSIPGQAGLPIEDLVWIDSSPYVRPLAELQDEYETYVVVIADASGADISLVTASRAQRKASVQGNIKNHVKKGGWSQQRYKRRRDKAFSRYAGEIVDEVDTLLRTHDCACVILAGSEEAIREIKSRCTPLVDQMHAASKVMQLAGKAEHELFEELAGVFAQTEREREELLWEQVQEAYLCGGSAVVGWPGVYDAIEQGRVEIVVVERDRHVAGWRCRACDRLAWNEPVECVGCGHDAFYVVDLLNEFVELLAQRGGSVDFMDSNEELSAVGGVAALLRW